VFDPAEAKTSQQIDFGAGQPVDEIQSEYM
jgi:hypothetical protein